MTEPQDLHCWQCGALIVDEPRPLSRRAECRDCRAELHCCRMCREYDPGIARQCREDRAEDVTDKERSNFCDWFVPRPNAYAPPDRAKADAARAELDALFGLGDADGADKSGDKADAARSELDRLFGLDRKGD